MIVFLFSFILPVQLFEMFRCRVVFFIMFVHSSLLHAQQLYTPRSIQQAFTKQTRSPDGRPGKNYWQNRGRYNITIKATPPDRTIQGTEQITYINNSPDTLYQLVFKLIVNVHLSGAVRLFPSPGDGYLTSGIHIDSLLINGFAQPYRRSPYNNTKYITGLRSALKPHDSTQVSVRWHYDVSLISNREGMIDSTTYFLAYFYPRVAVYDDYNGWDMTEFNDGLEFYNDFNDYTVNVQVPENYLVWGTGTLLNAAAVLQPPYLAKFNQSFTTDEIIHVATRQDLAAKNVTTQNALNTWSWKADHISDMAIGISDHFVWDASSVVVDNATRRRASVQSAYNDTAADFHYMVGFGRHALDWLSNNWPGIPYPYEKSTIMQGFADMEYPMMVNDGTTRDTAFSRFVAEHEIAHTYMPFYMGINETEYGFMDEGWATTFELLIGRANVGNEAAENLFKQFRVIPWIRDPSAGEDLPVITPGTSMNGSGLGNNEYGKPALGYLAMKDLLGDAMFKKCLHEYMNRWNGKHPLPWDFFYTFNDVSGKNLNWFWSNWFFSNYYIDLAIQQVIKTSDGYSASIQNIGGMAAPFDLIIAYADGTKETLHQTPAVWEANQKTTAIKIATKKVIRSVRMDGNSFMDADENNNTWMSK